MAGFAGDEPGMTQDTRAATDSGRVAFVLPHLGGGGGERSTLALARGLLERGHSVDILHLYDRVAYKDEIPSEARVLILARETAPLSGRAFQLPSKLGFRMRLALRRRHLVHAQWVADYLDRAKPDVLFSSLEDAKVASLLAIQCSDHKPSLSLIVRCDVRSRKRRYRRLYRNLFPLADHVVGVSQGVTAGVVRDLGIPRSRVSTIYNPVITRELFDKAGATPSHPWFSADGPPIVLAAGRLARAKNYPTLLRAFATASKSRPLRLVILGTGSWRSRLERLVRRLGLSGSVSMPGWEPNPFALMSRASLFAHASKWEGLSGVLIQAMACGCPCVSTNCLSGCDEILDHGRLGPLVPVGDHEALAAAMLRVLDSPPDKAALREQAMKFSAENSVAGYGQLISRLTEGRSAA